jgi:hypothetical protein
MCYQGAKSIVTPSGNPFVGKRSPLHARELARVPTVG